MFKSKTPLLIIFAGSVAALPSCLQRQVKETSGVSAVSSAGEITNGVYTIRSFMSNRCLDLPSGSAADNIVLQQYDCNGATAQQWRITRIAGNFVNITNAGTGKSIDVLWGSTANGARLVQYPLGNNQANQQFSIEGGGGKFLIRARNSKLVLDVTDFGKNNGAPIQQWGDGGSDNQRWAFTRVGGGGGNPVPNPAPAPRPAPAPAPTPGGGGGGGPAIGSIDGAWKLVWSDEFNGNSIDRGKWNLQLMKAGTVNNERQNYVDSPNNSRVEGGHLVIQTRKEGSGFTSARLNSAGKGFWKYGRIEARIKITAALGSWPAFWMMPEDQSKGWPTCGEIDILEEVGFDRDVIHGTTHTQRFFGANGRGGPRTLPNITNDYHVYGIEWYQDRIDWYADGVKYFTQRNDGGEDVYPFHKPFHIILNFALGGDWGGAKGFDANMPDQFMLVDWVRVYQLK